VHYIVESRLVVQLPRIVPNNSDLRELGDTSKWPPAMVVNLLYASAVLQAWAPEPFIENIRASRTTICRMVLVQGARTRRLNTRNRMKAQAAYPEETQISSVMDGVTALWMRSGKRNRQYFGLCSQVR
jgi:hypothetical protein